MQNKNNLKHYKFYIQLSDKSRKRKKYSKLIQQISKIQKQNDKKKTEPAEGKTIA